MSALRRSTYIVPTDGMQQAFDADMPVLLLPPDWPREEPEFSKKLYALVIDVLLKGSADRLRIMPTEAMNR